MICKKCGKELPDLTMYCTNCGAPQFAAPKPEVHLELADPSSSKVVINSCPNMTNAVTAIRALTGMTVPEIRKLLQELPAVLLSSLTRDEAENTASMLKENGVDAEAVHKEKKEPEPVPEETKPEAATAEPQPETAAAETPSVQEEPSFEEKMEAFMKEEKKEDKKEEPAPAEKPDEKVPVLTLEPSLMTDESFMQEMEEFLNKKD